MRISRMLRIIQTEVDNADRGLNNSKYPAKTESIILLLFIPFIHSRKIGDANTNKKQIVFFSIF